MTSQVVRQTDDGQSLVLRPYLNPLLAITWQLDYGPRAAIPAQVYSAEITPSMFVREIAPARTFGFLKDVELMRQKGLALGGSLDNAIVLGETGVLNNPLRFPDEFVRHKILDLLGDLVLLGKPLQAHVVGMRAGHQLHTQLVRAILESKESWELIEDRARTTEATDVSEPVLAPTARSYYTP